MLFTLAGASTLEALYHVLAMLYCSSCRLITGPSNLRRCYEQLDVGMLLWFGSLEGTCFLRRLQQCEQKARLCQL